MMFKKKDPNSFTAYFELYNGTPGNAGVSQIGYLVADYHVTRYDDVQANSRNCINKSNDRSFFVQCTQRIVISNSLSIHPGKYDSKYENYPALLNTYLNLSNANNNGIFMQVLEYSPKTVNTKVQQSGATGNSNGQTTGTSRSSTVGSSTSVTNSYGASVSVGLTELSDSASVNYENSTTNTTDQSSTIGNDSSTSSNQDSSNSAAMSVKDWGAYGMVNPVNQNPNWIFGQEYPWDAIECRKTDGSNTNPDNPNQDLLIVPQEMTARLYDGTCLYPPSQLSLFGINFVTKALWLVSLTNSAADEVSIEHNVLYSTGSHMLTDGNVQVFVDGEPVGLQCQSDSGDISTNLNLPLMALSVLGQAGKPAIIGFIPSKFTVLPNLAPFKIISTGNNLLIEDTTSYGDTYPASPLFSASETALTASFSETCAALNITAYFKVVDTVNDYKLYLKHWKTGTVGLMLTITINGDTSNAITKYVDATEAEGGENNLLTIALRDQNYASVDYHDYLQLGLNAIQLTIQPIGGVYIAGCGYQVRALSIEKS